MVRNTCGVRRPDRLIYRRSRPQTTLLRVSPKNLGRCHATGRPCRHKYLTQFISVQETRDMSLPQQYVSYQDNGAPAYQANISCPYDSGGDDCPDGGQNMLTITTQHYYYNQRDAWTTTAIPPAAKNVASLMAGSQAMQPDPVPDSPSGVTANTRRTRLEDGSADIPPTQKKGKSKAKHDLSDGQEVLFPGGCMRNGYPRTYVRRDTLRKHLMESCKGRIGDKPRLDAKAIEALVVKPFHCKAGSPGKEHEGFKLYQ
ncbi:hypothetical protein JB92DRAFT_3014976 [Gautieria morchelliformis]|nr:hypothetical protein JB92DRAFT_3014976 [Gautieria morchelliformis]